MDDGGCAESGERTALSETAVLGDERDDDELEADQCAAGRPYDDVEALPHRQRAGVLHAGQSNTVGGPTRLFSRAEEPEYCLRIHLGRGRHRLVRLPFEYLQCTGRQHFGQKPNRYRLSARRSPREAGASATMARHASDARIPSSAAAGTDRPSRKNRHAN